MPCSIRFLAVNLRLCAYEEGDGGSERQESLDCDGGYTGEIPLHGMLRAPSFFLFLFFPSLLPICQ